MEEIRGPAGRTMWDKLANVNETVLANYLKNEYPQTVAVVLSKIKPEHSARVLGALPEEFAMEVVQRMLRMDSVQKDILDKVEKTLRVEFMSNLARTAKRDAHEQMADIFNNFDRQTESRFLTALEERSRDSAERIKALMFTFEDLGKLDPGSIQTLLRHVEKDKLGLALKGSTDTLRDVFFSNMSERAGKILREDMEAMGPVRLKDVDEAQMRMVNVAKDLANKGEIMIASKQGEDELIY
jgi:flagellar motor switch protein FliG